MNRSVVSGHWLVLVCVAAFFLTYLAPVDASFSDPWGTLVTAQAIVDHGTVRLDSYVQDNWLYGPIRPAENGHFYDYFPLGTALAAVPAVWLAALRGKDMTYPEDNWALQNILSSITVVVCALLIYALCRLFLSLSASLVLTVVFVFGASTVSTLGTALWSSNLALVLGLAIIFVLARSERCAAEAPPEVALGVLVFLAYLCRPTMALLAPVVVVYLIHRERRIPVSLIATVALSFGLFVVFSWLEYGYGLPPYYQPSRLNGIRFWQALYGHLASPSRGVLVLSPFLLVTLAGLVIWIRRLGRERLIWLAASWIALHWIAVSSFHDWWGGWSFGNRLFVDVLPAFLLLTILVVARAGRELSPSSSRLASGLFLATAAFAVFVHSQQGLYNVYTILWNKGINSDESRVFDWRHPQFLASPAMLGVHNRTHRLLDMVPYASGESVLPTSSRVVFEGWSIPEGDGQWRWSNNHSPSLLFKVGESIAGAKEAILEIEAGTYGLQMIEIRVNGVSVGELQSERNWEPSTYAFTVPARAIEAARRPLPGARIFEIEVEIPGAMLVGEAPTARRLGLCFWGLTLRGQ